METIPYKLQAEYCSDIRAARKAIADGVVVATQEKRRKYWLYWKQYTKPLNVDPYLQYKCLSRYHIDIITGFLSRVRSGHYGNQSQIKVQNVQDAIRGIAQTIQLAGLESPLHQDAKHYILPIERLVASYRKADPPPQQKLAVPVSVPEYAYKLGKESSNPKMKAAGELTMIAFFYLLRVGEYTPPRHNKHGKKKNRTEAFRVKDVTFWKNTQILPRRSPLKVLLTATSASLTITNQKNGHKGQTIHQYSTGHDICPVRALAERVNHIYSHGGNNNALLCEYYDSRNNKQNITSNIINTTIRVAVTNLGLDKMGITTDLVSTHSLRAGGATAMSLNGENDTMIQKMGRWTSNTFLTYIQTQIGALTKGISRRMTRHINYFNVALKEKDELPQQAPTTRRA